MISSAVSGSSGCALAMPLHRHAARACSARRINGRCMAISSLFGGARTVLPDGCCCPPPVNTSVPERGLSAANAAPARDNFDTALSSAHCGRLRPRETHERHADAIPSRWLQARRSSTSRRQPLGPRRTPTPRRREVDVLIVGCGPAGLTLAAQLAAFPDIRTCIVEQKDGPAAARAGRRHRLPHHGDVRGLRLQRARAEGGLLDQRSHVLEARREAARARSCATAACRTPKTACRSSRTWC